MSTRMTSIVLVTDHEYEVIFDVDGTSRRCICRVAEEDGIRVVEPFPDIFATLAIPPRLIAAAVLAFDVANRTFMDSGL